MSNKSLRAFSAGLILSTGIFAVSYYYISPESSEPAVTQEQIDSYLAEQEKTAISNEEYASLKTASIKPGTEKKSAVKQPVKDDKPSEEIYRMTLSVTQGMSTGEVCDELERGKIIKSSSEFLKYLRSTNREGAVRFGSYNVNSKMSAEVVANIITSP
ncbi:hypothetical protein ACFFJY_07835 [Fictibacillus aquaticus]|uniref:Aminodeoxychorismate lyase n=1 Tax=Fictibacillus aquaticus TaxID=2021314 RepID=A0A235F9R7_9BACL|nr:hypothetical protein [Fictibacillus aquaticus]OYD57909.1 hypothetical protein CGZ90_08385 [Fictibacillus aquaticus]